MILYLIAVWALAAPPGYLAGDVYAAQNYGPDDDIADIIPWIAAAFPPLAAVLAVIVITQANGE